MFKKLKDKIAEEVKSSPSRIQQFAQAAQAAVSSTSSLASDTVSASENFFSITEEETPQNSPHHSSTTTTTATIQTPLNKPNQNNSITGGHSLSLLNNGNGSGSGVGPYRTRKLSNSSMASDVSFRLPTYDSPAVYHLQSDMESASEFEDTSISGSTSNIHLEMISKDQLHEAYKKALEKYQKYRGRYQDVAKRYRDLERDNNKARSVLVETQDKALRRISELREQCSLEQQAKAHLESALRMEMDEMQCVIKTLTEKLSVIGERINDGGEVTEINNSIQKENLIQLELSPPQQKNDSLINLNDDNVNGNDKTSVTDIVSKEINLQLKELTEKLNISNKTIEEMKKREEENTILLAENKMMIHSELENKEKEVRNLEEKLTTLQDALKKTVTEKTKLQELSSKLKSDINDMNERVKESEATIKRSEKNVLELEKSVSQLESSKKEVEAKLIIMESERETRIGREFQALKSDYNAMVKKNEDLEKDFQIKSKEMQEKLLSELKHVKEAHAEASKKLNETETKKQSFASEIDTQKIRIAELINDVKRLESENKDDNLIEEQLNQQTNLYQKLLTETESMKIELLATKSDHDITTRLVESLKIELTNSKQETQSLIDNKAIELAELNKKHAELILTLETSKSEIEKLMNKAKSVQDTNVYEKSKADQRFEQLQQEKQHICSEFESVKSQNSAMKSQIVQLEQTNEKLLVKHESDSETTNKDAVLAVQLQESIKLKLEETNNQLTEANTKIISLEEQLLNVRREKDDSDSDMLTLKNKIDSLKSEKRDLEKTLEKEIRDKSELKTQVTNILQEIGRLEEQLTEVKHSYAEIEKEKRALEERSNEKAKTKVDKSQHDQVQNTLKELEKQLVELEQENRNLNDRNQVLENASSEIQQLLTETKDHLLAECNRSKELDENLSSLRFDLAQSNETNEKLQIKLKECVDENARIFNAKELLDHEYRSLQDQLEVKDKEKLCVLDTNKSLELDIAKLRENKSNDTQSMENEKTKLTEECDSLQIQLESVKLENSELKQTRDEIQVKCLELTAQIESTTENKVIYERQLEDLKAANADTNKSLVDECDAMLHEVQKLKKENQQYLSELTVATKERNAVEKKLEAEIKELTNLNQQYLSHLKEATDESQSLRKELDKLKDTVKKDTDKSTKEIAKLTKESNDLSVKVKSLEIQFGDTNDENVKLSEQNKEYSIENEKLKAVCQRAQNFNEELQNDLRQQKELVDSVTIRNDELQSVQSISETQIKSLKSKLGHAEQLNETYQNELRKQKANCDEEIQNQTEAKSKLDASNEELSKSRDRLKESETARADLSLELEASQAIISDLNKDLERNEDRITELQRYEIENEKLQEKITDLLEQSSLKSNAKSLDELEQLRRINESLKLEIAEQKRRSDGEISNLHNEIDELNENARAYREKSTEVEFMKENMAKLEQELKAFQLSSSSSNIGVRENMVHAVSISHQLSAVNDSMAVTSENDDDVEKLRIQRDDLQNKLKKIMHDVQDVSSRNQFLEQQCENYLIMEQSNERLKLQNEKLSRQLDDTLVSLQHSEGMAANTEFEYLRNIMFQYLTNNINSNGTTLVKVIAAVLKFSPQQTQVALERESQRKTLVGQLNSLL